MMGWNISLIGKPEKVAQALRDLQRMTGDSKTEFDEALPHLLGLVNLNYRNEEGARMGALTIHLDASGHGFKRDGRGVHSNCNVQLKQLPATLVT
jgi:hypothetical protein